MNKSKLPHDFIPQGQSNNKKERKLKTIQEKEAAKNSREKDREFVDIDEFRTTLNQLPPINLIQEPDGHMHVFKRTKEG